MPFYSGKGSGVVFTSETRPGTVLTLFADEWGIEIEDESIHISNIKSLRDANIEGDIVNGDLSAVPAWKNYGIPMQMLNGGMRETKVTIHGYLFLDNSISINDGPRVPIINGKGQAGNQIHQSSWPETNFIPNHQFGCHKHKLRQFCQKSVRI